MKNGTITRRCRCTAPETGKDLGASRPKLQSSRWHGTYGVFQEPNKVRALLAIPEENDAWRRTQISDLLENSVKDRSPLPDQTRSAAGSRPDSH
ncbi:hypothetical protein AB0O07_19140 [Streptomyces sp. NPDC093085]|uniref:hypothetical protein n=1 Tax=Streptomyces sp. NPDC093085 TaxID=3155068 RepID=UPI00344289DD